MIVHDPHVARPVVDLPKTDAPSHVDPNAVPAGPVTPQCLQPTAAQRGQIAERFRVVQQSRPARRLTRPSRQLLDRPFRQGARRPRRSRTVEAPRKCPTPAGCDWLRMPPCPDRSRRAGRRGGSRDVEPHLIVRDPQHKCATLSPRQLYQPLARQVRLVASGQLPSSVRKSGFSRAKDWYDR